MLLDGKESFNEFNHVKIDGYSLSKFSIGMVVFLVVYVDGFKRGIGLVEVKDKAAELCEETVETDVELNPNDENNDELDTERSNPTNLN